MRDVFTYVNSRQENSQPLEFLIGTDTEAFVLGEILTLSSGALTKGAVDSTGEQKFICMAAVTGDGSTANVPTVRLRKDMQFSATATATVAATLVGSKVTLNAAATQPTATTTNGVFEIDETDGATSVIGHFTNVDSL